MANEPASGKGRGVLEGAFALLEELACAKVAGLPQLVAATGLPKSTAHRLLDQLIGLGAVHRRNDRYYIGSLAFRLGQGWQPIPALSAAARRPLWQLSVATRRASVTVLVPEAGRTVVAAGVVGEVDEVVPLRPGSELVAGNPMDVFLADDRTGAEPPEPYSRREWARLVIRARERGVVIHELPHRGPAHAVAVPVFSPSGEIVAAVCAGVLASRRLHSVTPAVARAAGMISANLAKAVPAHG